GPDDWPIHPTLFVLSSCGLVRAVPFAWSTTFPEPRALGVQPGVERTLAWLGCGRLWPRIPVRGRGAPSFDTTVAFAPTPPRHICLPIDRGIAPKPRAVLL